MKALVKEKSEVGLKLQEVEKPKIKSDDVLIKVKATAICGTDLHIWNWDAWASKTIKPPMTVGHEFMGEVVEIGDDVKDLALGDRVSAESHIVGCTSRNARAGKLHLDPDTVNLGVSSYSTITYFSKIFELVENQGFNFEEIILFFDPSDVLQDQSYILNDDNSIKEVNLEDDKDNITRQKQWKRTNLKDFL